MIKYKIYEIDRGHLASVEARNYWDSNLRRVCLIEQCEYTAFDTMEAAIQSIKDMHEDEDGPYRNEYVILPIYFFDNEKTY